MPNSKEKKTAEQEEDFFFACDDFDKKLMKKLVKKGVNVECRNQAGDTPLTDASAKGFYDTAKALIKLGADLEATTSDGLTPLHVAAINSEAGCFALLLKKGANPHAKAPDGKTAGDLIKGAKNEDELRHALSEALAAGEAEELKVVTAKGKPKWADRTI